MKFNYILAELKLILAALVLACVVGLIVGSWAPAIAAALLLILLFFLHQSATLSGWLENEARIESRPNLFGVADQIVSQVCAIKKENNLKHENLTDLINRFEAATSAMPDAMLIVNSQLRIEWANPAAQKILGIDLGKDVGQQVGHIVRDLLIADYLSATDYTNPLEFSSSGSKDNDLMLRVIPYGDEGYKLLYVHDHSDFLRLQKMRKSFISDASHEMRTPLTVIIGYLEALTLREISDSATRQGIEGALEQAHRLKQLIEDLLSLSRLESKPISHSDKEAVNIHILISESIELIKASTLYSAHDFDIQMDEQAIVFGVYSELKSAIQNIVENAVKYSAMGTKIIIKWVDKSSSRSVLIVTDQGEGVEQSKINRLTERFYRVDHGRSRDMGGSGLGLAIVKHIMERHQGELVITSEIGVGTSVELHFPANSSSPGNQVKSVI
ncbi:MAG: phosphate regulon sensor histidine kinase PhoR [Pseudomonadota bacterium]